jgi:HAD superfamily hydrolase (TIGR01544 family)
MSKSQFETINKEHYIQLGQVKESNINYNHNHNKSIHFTDKLSFDKKLKGFISSYYNNKKSVAVVTDFDFTITSKIDYKNGKEYKSSYYLYDEDIIGGDQKSFNEKRKALADKYSLYEFSTSFDFETRKNKMEEWYTKGLELYFNEKFTQNSIDKMIEVTKDNILFRKYAKEYIELLVSLGITVIIESGGLGDFIEGILKLEIPNIEEYLKERKIIIVSNFFKYDVKTKGCIGAHHEVINCFNKADFLGSVVNKELPELKHVLVLGDNLGDADSIKKINIPKNNVIGLGFLNLPLDVINDEKKKNYLKKKIEEYKKSFDVVLVGDCNYEPVIEILKNIKVKN